jgi:hypothetical protein
VKWEVKSGLSAGWDWRKEAERERWRGGRRFEADGGKIACRIDRLHYTISELKDTNLRGEYLLPLDAGITLTSEVRLWRLRTRKTIAVHCFDLDCRKY